MDSATELLFGESVDSLTSLEGSEQQIFAAAFDLAQKRLAKRNSLWPFRFLSRDSEFDNACKTVHNFVDKIVYKALRHIQAQDAEKMVGGKEQSERYVFLHEMARATKNPKRLRDEVLNVLLAGRDTTASLLSHTFHVLARRRDIWQKLKAEVDELKGRVPDYETLKDMKYLKHILNECKSIIRQSPLGNTLISPSSPPLPRRPSERPLRQQGDLHPPRRWSRWPIIYLHRSRASSQLLFICHASTQRHLRVRRRGIPAGEVGQRGRSSARLGIPTV